MSEQEVSEEYRVSRTPIREVFMYLLQDELVEIYPQRGTYVSLINLKHLEEGRFVRELLEKAVIREAAGCLSKDDLFRLETNLAAQQISCRDKDFLRMLALDDDFHATIFRACEKDRTWSAINQLNHDFFRARVLRLSHDFKWDRIVEQHHTIFRALKKGDKDLAEQVISEHLRMVIMEKEELRTQYPDYFVKV